MGIGRPGAGGEGAEPFAARRREWLRPHAGCTAGDRPAPRGRETAREESAVDLGVSLPTSGPHASPRAIVHIAQEAERLGYAAVWTYERLLYALGDIPQPGGPPRPLPEYYAQTYEPIETLAYVAAKTERIKLGTSVLDAP